MTGTHWTEVRIIHATERWKAGASAGVIAEELGDVTRCAVIGLIARKGLQRRGMFDGALCRRQRAAKPIPEATLPVHLPRSGPGVPLALASRDGCRFAVSGDDAQLHLFCDAPRRLGHSYCAPHCAIAYRISEKRRAA